MWEKIKGSFLYIAAPIAAVFGYIYYLSMDRNKLKQELASKDAQKNIDGILTKKDEAKKDADQLEDEYNKLKSDYDSESHGAGGDTNL